MTNSDASFNQKLITFLEIIAKEGMTNAARGLGSMVGASMTVTDPNIKMVPMTEITDLLGGPENEAVGIYLRIEGEVTGQIMLALSYTRALELANLLLCTDMDCESNDLGSMERSALAEVGNLTASFFLNTLARMTGLDARPSPPAVVVDMVGAIVDIIVATTGGISDHILVLSAKFVMGERTVDSEFWVIPDQQTLEIINSRQKYE